MKQMFLSTILAMASWAASASGFVITLDSVHSVSPNTVQIMYSVTLNNGDSTIQLGCVVIPDSPSGPSVYANNFLPTAYGGTVYHGVLWIDSLVPGHVYKVTVFGMANLDTTTYIPWQVEMIFHTEPNAVAVFPTKESKIKIFPNPIENMISISNPQWMESEYNIFDLYGRKILTLQPRTETQNFNINIPSGNYFIKIRDEVHRFIRK